MNQLRLNTKYITFFLTNFWVSVVGWSHLPDNKDIKYNLIDIEIDANKSPFARLETAYTYRFCSNRRL